MGPVPPCDGAILGERICPSMPDNTLPWAVQNGWTGQNAIWVVSSGGLKEPCIRLGPDPLCEGAIFRGKNMPELARRHCSELWKMTEQIEMLFWIVDLSEPTEACFTWGAHWRLWRMQSNCACLGGTDEAAPCGLMSNYFDHLLLLGLQNWFLFMA